MPCMLELQNEGVQACNKCEVSAKSWLLGVCRSLAAQRDVVRVEFPCHEIGGGADGSYV